MAKVAINDDILASVANIAYRRNLSVEQQVEEILLAATAHQPGHKNRMAVFKEISALTPPGIRQTDSVDLLRQDRNR